MFLLSSPKFVGAYSLNRSLIFMVVLIVNKSQKFTRISFSNFTYFTTVGLFPVRRMKWTWETAAQGGLFGTGHLLREGEAFGMDALEKMDGSREEGPSGSGKQRMWRWLMQPVALALPCFPPAALCWVLPCWVIQDSCCTFLTNSLIFWGSREGQILPSLLVPNSGIQSHGQEIYTLKKVCFPCLSTLLCHLPVSLFLCRSYTCR